MMFQLVIPQNLAVLGYFFHVKTSFYVISIIIRNVEDKTLRQ